MPKKKLPPPAPPAPPELLATLDLAQKLRVSPRQILNMHSRGQLPRGRKVPGLGLRWLTSEVDEWLAEKVGEDVTTSEKLGYSKSAGLRGKETSR